MCLGYAKIAEDDKRTKESWTEEFFSWPDELPLIISRVHELKDNFDVYFSPYLFSEQASKKEHVIIGRTIVADLDEANVLTLTIAPSVLVETSSGRHQGYWILKEQLDFTQHEELSKRLTYSIPRCDRNGWFAGKKVRVPETNNNKYTSGPQQVRIVQDSARVYNNSVFENIASPKELYGKNFKAQILEVDEDLSWVDEALNQDTGPLELLHRVRSSIPTIVSRYNILSKDRSAALWSLNMSLFRAGMAKEQVFYIAYHSPNNKFKDLRYGGLKELGKDVLRAELASKLQLPDIKAIINDARKLSDNVNDKNTYIAKRVREHLDMLGNFIHASDDSFWFIREDNGRPIQITSRSDVLNNMLDNVFGLNSSDRESTYVNRSLQAMISELPITGKIANLSSYDHDSKLFMLHTGKKDILVVRPNGITREVNGYNGIIFPWSVANNVISPHYQALESVWEDELFDDCLNNLLGTVTKKQAKAVLKVWFLSILLRDGLNSRPILALFGQPGSGKSTLFRRVYTLLYGREKGIGSITKEEHFDQAMSAQALLVLDNVDQYSPWLPDRLAATIGPTEILKRKLYTDNDTVVIRRTAMLGITAHNPKFGREDVTDRLLLLNFERFSEFRDETLIYDRILALRNGLWGQILKDIQIVLGTNMPSEGYPQFRIQDFAKFGFWIASALGIAKEFKEGIEAVKQEQRSFNLEEDTLVVNAIERMLRQETIIEMNASQLWQKLKRYSGEEKAFERRYQNAVSFGRKLWTLIDSLRELFEVDWSVRRNVRIWTIAKLDDIEHEPEHSRETNGTSSSLFGRNS